MGQAALMVVQCDATGGIRSDAEFGRKVIEAVQQAALNPRNRVDIASGSHANAAHVVTVSDVSFTGLALFGGGSSQIIATTVGGNFLNSDVQLSLLKEFADRLGYKLERKAETSA